MITEREKEILRIIRENPMIRQQDLAERIGITRSSIAVHISNLMRKGYIEGKGYVVRDAEYVTIVGGANIDLIGFSNDKIVAEDSNPGQVETLLGGVGRNQAHNLRLLGIDVRLITAFGSDFNGDRLRHDCLESGIDISNSLIVPNSKTSTYLSIIDCEGALYAGINEMDIFRHITPDVILPIMPIINRSAVCMVDTNIEQQTIETLVKNVKVPVFCETISAVKTHRIENVLSYIHTLRSDLSDVESLINKKIKNKAELISAVDILLDRGIQNVFIALSPHEVICATQSKKLQLSYSVTKIFSKNGARDSFMAALVWAFMKEADLETALLAGMASAVICASSKNMVNEQLDETLLVDTMEKFRKDCFISPVV